MKQITHVVLGAAAALLLAGCSPPSPLRAPESNETVAGKAVSLRALQAQLQSGGPEAREAGLETLCGLTRIVGVVQDTANDDLVIVGVEGNGTPLHTGDLAVALRCVFDRYGRRDGNTIIVEAPAVSIDPNPDVIRELHRALSGTSIDAATAAAYRGIAASPQHVRVLGMPPDCTMAEAAVAADYDMKRWVQGTHSRRLEGFTSLYDARRRQKGGSFDRFWFTAGEAKYMADTGVVVLKAAPVRLLTEAEALSSGKIDDTGMADSNALAFCDQMTRRFPELAQETPYAELASLFRTVDIAAMIRKEFPGADQTLSYLLDGYAVPTAAVPRSLPGLSRVEIESRDEGNYMVKSIHAACGGVDLLPRLTSSSREAAPSPQARQAAAAACAQRPSTSSLTWPVQIPVQWLGQSTAGVAGGAAPLS